MHATGHFVWFMRKTPYPVWIESTKTVKQCPATQREMSWREDSESGVRRLNVAITGKFKTAFRRLRRADAEICAPLLDAALSRKSLLAPKK